MGFLAPLLPAIPGIMGGALALGNNGDQNKPIAAQLGNPLVSGQIQQGYDQSQQALDQQRAFLSALQGQGGIGNQSNVFDQQQALANQLQAIGNGQGPNPALEQLRQATGQNIASQASLMGSQRGVGANPGLLARQAAMQGGNIQQQAVGQGATMQAQQQLDALRALQGQQANMANLSSQQVGQQAGALGNLNQLSQGLYGQGLGALGQYNATQASMQGNINDANAAVRKAQEGRSAGGLSGLIGSAGTLLPLLAASDGGAIPNLKENYGPSSRVGKHFHSYKSGGKVAGKASVAGDSEKNDTVPALLSPGEIVVPRSHTSDPNKAAEFAKAVAMRMRRQ